MPIYGYILPAQQCQTIPGSNFHFQHLQSLKTNKEFIMRNIKYIFLH